MYRSSRLIAEHATPELRQTIIKMCQVQTGDTLTGWEIIAGLPLEEQQSMVIKSCLPEGISTEYLRIEKQYKSRFLALRNACNSLYRWNGEAWEVVE